MRIFCGCWFLRRVFVEALGDADLRLLGKFFGNLRAVALCLEGVGCSIWPVSNSLKIHLCSLN